MSKTDHNNLSGSDSKSKIRPDLEGEEYRDSTFYKPISTREYFRLLGYCVIGFLALALVFILFSMVTN